MLKIILILSAVTFFQIQTFAESIPKHDYKIPKAVIRFAEKNQCTDLVKNTSFERPWYGYKGYNVYNGHDINDYEDNCIILYKYGITRFAKDNEVPQILLLESPPLPPGLWWQWFREYRKLYHIPLRRLLFG